MGISLSKHNYAYQFSFCDVLTSLATGASGLPYAKRHYELSNIESSWVAHRIIAAIEVVPVLGGAVALIERIACSIFGHSSIPWREEGLSHEKALDKMMRNGQKAIVEHHAKGSFFSNPFPKNLGISKADLVRQESTPLKFSLHFADAQGPRPTMEDAHFYKELGGGVLTGVFDGHGGGQVSAYASAQFEKRFPKALQQANGNVHEAFELVIHQVHQKVANYSLWNGVGSTAVVCYIDKDTHQIYTATLGDSEANIYRKGWTGITSIPLSCVRDWMSPSDLNRLMTIYGFKNVQIWLNHVGHKAKFIRSHLFNGVNIARGIGDVEQTGSPSQPRVIHKPKITVNKLLPGDTLILACDGLKDFVCESAITAVVGSKSSEPVAQRLVNTALSKMNARENDNVTVVAVEIA